MTKPSYEELEAKLKKTSWMRGMISSQALTIRERNAELLRVRGLLQRYGSHTSQCAINQTRMVGAPWKQCDCGWTTDIYPILTDAMGNSLVGAESADIGKLDTADKCTHRRTTFIIDQSDTDPIVESLMCNGCLKRFEEVSGSAETGGEKAAATIVEEWTQCPTSFHFMGRLVQFQDELVGLRKFKQYVHDRLDAAGIHKHQEQNAINGCRIGSRLDDVLRISDAPSRSSEARPGVGGAVGSNTADGNCGVVGAHEGITADKSGLREPEKLNTFTCGCKGTDGRCPVHDKPVVALAESSLSSPPPVFRFCPNGYRSHACFNGLCSVCGDLAVSEFPTAPPTPTERGAESVHSGKQNTAYESELLPTQLPKEK